MNNDRGGSATPKTSSGNMFELLSEDFPNIQHKKRARREDVTQLQKEQQHNGKFIIISHADPNQDLNKLCPFVVMKALEGYTSGLQNITRLRNGTLLVETKNAKQTAALYKADTLGPEKIKVKDHPTLNTTRGTVFSYDLLHLEEEYLLQNLKSQNVINVERIMKFNDAKQLVPTPTLILTFEGKVLSLTIKAGFLSLRTRMYYPAPMKCKSCHKFGHTKKKCRGDPICAGCSKPLHTGACAEMKCLNCTRFYPMFKDNPHSANDKNCIKYQEEKAIIKIMVDESKMYKEARSKFNQLYPKTLTESTFASTVKMNNNKNHQRRENSPKRYKTNITPDPQPHCSYSISPTTSNSAINNIRATRNDQQFSYTKDQISKDSRNNKYKMLTTKEKRHPNNYANTNVQEKTDQTKHFKEDMEEEFSGFEVDEIESSD